MRAPSARQDRPGGEGQAQGGRLGHDRADVALLPERGERGGAPAHRADHAEQPGRDDPPHGRGVAGDGLGVGRDRVGRTVHVVSDSVVGGHSSAATTLRTRNAAVHASAP